MLVIFRPLHFSYQMLCPLWDPIAAAQRSQHGEQKQWQTTSTPKRRYSHPQCGTRPTTRDEKQRNNGIHISTKTSWKYSTRHYRANTPGGDNRKLTQLSIINKESRNIPTPTVIWQRHPTNEHPVNISALKRKEFYALVVLCLNTACK